MPDANHVIEVLKGVLGEQAVALAILQAELEEAQAKLADAQHATEKEG